MKPRKKAKPGTKGYRGKAEGRAGVARTAKVEKKSREIKATTPKAEVLDAKAKRLREIKDAREKRLGDLKEKRESKQIEADKLKEDPAYRKKVYRDGIVKTISPGALGAAAGVISFFALDDPRNLIALSLIAIMVLMQRFILPFFKIEAKDIKPKDWLYLSFLTFDFWFVTYAVLLNI